MIKLEIEEKKFDKVIFKNTEIIINDGDFVCIKGPSGIGKSTLLSMIGLLEKFQGKYYFDNTLINDKNKESLRINNFAYVFQNPYLIPYLSVKDNILQPLKNLKKEIDINKFNEVANLLDVTPLLNRSVDKLSGGEAQRVSLLRAVLTDRKIILCDEPTGSLDPNNARIVMNKLKEINQKYHVTIIIVSHSKEFDDYFSKLFYLQEGKINYVK